MPKTIEDLDKDLTELRKSLIEPRFRVEQLEAATSVKIGGVALLPLPPGTELLRVALPLALASGAAFVDIGAGSWTPVTTTVLGNRTDPTGMWGRAPAPLSGARRQLRLIIGSANNCVSPEGDVVKYRIFFSAAGQPDNREYPGYRYWAGDPLDPKDREGVGGGWEMIDLDHLANPASEHYQGSYWRLQCFTSGCNHRVYSVTLHLVDIVQ